ncbi:hypothetical protein CTheo_1444 [Ceratobasidium theobromae]|uniref:Uncharacterized protein n=1 Tax=Ceratobasidium theobromae TaxID=1582974 RepID=A0A5N5QVF5_9AGAM|nr:hypothetical protein CTheo_1444 [Ceratobasidium theobromae]
MGIPSGAPAAHVLSCLVLEYASRIKYSCAIVIVSGPGPNASRSADARYPLSADRAEEDPAEEEGEVLNLPDLAKYFKSTHAFTIATAYPMHVLSRRVYRGV